MTLQEEINTLLAEEESKSELQKEIDALLRDQTNRRRRTISVTVNIFPVTNLAN